MLGLGLHPSLGQVETMLCCTHTTYFSMCHGFFSRDFNTGQLLQYHLFKRDIFLNTQSLSPVTPALNTRLKFSKVNIISDLKNKAFESVF